MPHSGFVSEEMATAGHRADIRQKIERKDYVGAFTALSEMRAVDHQGCVRNGKQAADDAQAPIKQDPLLKLILESASKDDDQESLKTIVNKVHDGENKDFKYTLTGFISPEAAQQQTPKKPDAEEQVESGMLTNMYRQWQNLGSSKQLSYGLAAAAATVSAAAVVAFKMKNRP